MFRVTSAVSLSPFSPTSWTKVYHLYRETRDFVHFLTSGRNDRRRYEKFLDTLATDADDEATRETRACFFDIFARFQIVAKNIIDDDVTERTANNFDGDRKKKKKNTSVANSDKKVLHSGEKWNKHLLQKTR